MELGEDDTTEQHLGSKAHSGYSGINLSAVVKAEKNMKSADLNLEQPGVQVKIRRRNKAQAMEDHTEFVSKSPLNPSELDSAKETLPINIGKGSVSVGKSTKGERNIPTLQSTYPRYPKNTGPVQ